MEKIFPQYENINNEKVHTFTERQLGVVKDLVDLLAVSSKSSNAGDIRKQIFRILEISDSQQPPASQEKYQAITSLIGDSTEPESNKRDLKVHNLESLEVLFADARVELDKVLDPNQSRKYFERRPSDEILNNLHNLKDYIEIIDDTTLKDKCFKILNFLLPYFVSEENYPFINRLYDRDSIINNFELLKNYLTTYFQQKS